MKTSLSGTHPNISSRASFSSVTSPSSAQAALQGSEAAHDAVLTAVCDVLDLSPQPALVFEAGTGRVIHLNAALRELSDLSPDSVDPAITHEALPTVEALGLPACIMTSFDLEIESVRLESPFLGFDQCVLKRVESPRGILGVFLFRSTHDARVEFGRTRDVARGQPLCVRSHQDTVFVLNQEGLIDSISLGSTFAGSEQNWQIDGRHLVEVFSAEDREAALSALGDAGAGRVRSFVACGASELAGRWWDVILTPVRGEDGRTDQILGVLRDITERIQAEERYRSLVSVLSSVVWVCSAEGRFTTLQPSWERYTGQAWDEYRDYGWRDAIHVDDRELVWKAWRDAQLHGMNHGCEARLFHRDSGEYRYVTVRAVPVPGNKGSATEWIGTVTDIDEQVRSAANLRRHIAALRFTQAQLRDAKDAAERANEAKSHFLANMSHEIRTPLGAIIGFADLAAEAMTDGERTQHIQSISRNARHLSDLVDDVLDISKIEANRLEIESLEFDPAELLGDVSALLLPRAHDKGLDFRVRAASALPRRLVSDPTRLKQVLVNLVGNALKFTERGVIDLVCAAEPSASDSGRWRVEFTVRDTGIGLSSEQSARLFRPFAQADSSMTRKYGGTGLGLALSWRIAQALGGRLWLESSEPGKGSVFKFVIDLKAGSGAASRERFSGDGGPSERPLAGARILLVEDSPDNRILISRYLSAAGADVIVAENGLIGVAKAAETDPDLILMDLQMPVLDGYSALAKLRESGFAAPIIALTAHALVEEKLRALSLGFDDYLTKPVNRRLLVERVAQKCHTSIET